jgi:hypothetical protein
MDFIDSQITHQWNARYFHFLFFNPYICFSLYKVIFRGFIIYIYFTSIFYVCYYSLWSNFIIIYRLQLFDVLVSNLWVVKNARWR